MPSQLIQSHQAALVKAAFRYCDAYGLVQGPVHAEARITKDGMFLIELAGRTMWTIDKVFITARLEEIVTQGLHEVVPSLTKKSLCAGVLMIPVKNSGILRI